MAYIRIKNVPYGSDNYYRYLVKGQREGDDVKQKVIKYLGPAKGPKDHSIHEDDDLDDLPDDIEDKLGTTKDKKLSGGEKAIQKLKEDGYHVEETKKIDVKKYDTGEIKTITIKKMQKNVQDPKIRSVDKTLETNIVTKIDGKKTDEKIEAFIHDRSISLNSKNASQNVERMDISEEEKEKQREYERKHEKYGANYKPSYARGQY